MGGNNTKPSTKEVARALKKIFMLAERAYERIFLDGGELSYRVRKQEFFPKGAIIEWRNYDLGGEDFRAWADPSYNIITVNFDPAKLDEIDDEMNLKAVLVHELTHIMQFGVDGPLAAETDEEHGYLKACEGRGVFGHGLRNFFSFLSPIEVEAMVYEGILMRRDFYGKSTPLEGLEWSLRFFFLDSEVEQKAFAREHAITNIIPNSTRLRALFMGDPAYMLNWHELSGKAEHYARAARRFIHVQNSISSIEESAVRRAVDAFKELYGNGFSPSVFDGARSICRERKGFKCDQIPSTVVEGEAHA